MKKNDSFRKGFEEGLREELREIYVQRMAWARHFNQIIWFSFSIFFPLSIVGFSKFNQVDKLTYSFIGLASIFVMTVWHFLAEGHRRLWKMRFEDINAIEEVWGVETIKKAHKIEDKKEEVIINIRLIRHFIVISIILLWLISILVKLFI